jgi:hypothetical protein
VCVYRPLMRSREHVCGSGVHLLFPVPRLCPPVSLCIETFILHPPTQLRDTADEARRHRELLEKQNADLRGVVSGE